MSAFSNAFAWLDSREPNGPKTPFHNRPHSSFAKLVCPRNGDVARQQTRSPALSPPGWLPVNHKDRSNRTTASRPARIADGDRSALLCRIAPQSGCRRCQGTHDRAVWGKLSWHLQAREKAAALRWRQLQGRLSSEFPLRFTSQNIHLFCCIESASAP